MTTNKSDTKTSPNAGPSSRSKPYDLHILVCTNARAPGEKKSCGPLGADGLRSELKDWLKQEIASRPAIATRIKARVNASGCLDFCSRGVVMALYPDGDFLLDVKASDTEWVKNRIKEKLDQLEHLK